MNQQDEITRLQNELEFTRGQRDEWRRLAAEQASKLDSVVTSEDGTVSIFLCQMCGQKIGEAHHSGLMDLSSLSISPDQHGDFIELAPNE